VGIPGELGLSYSSLFSVRLTWDPGISMGLDGI
jgi:hypothetical protein